TSSPWTLDRIIDLRCPATLLTPSPSFDGQNAAIIGAPDDAPARLGGIEVPTLVLCGSKDTLTTPADAAEVASLVPGARLVTLKGAGHGLMLEAAPDFNEAVLRFLGGVEHRSATTSALG